MGGLKGLSLEGTPTRRGSLVAFCRQKFLSSAAAWDTCGEADTSSMSHMRAWRHTHHLISAHRPNWLRFLRRIRVKGDRGATLSAPLHLPASRFAPPFESFLLFYCKRVTLSPGRHVSKQLAANERATRETAAPGAGSARRCAGSDGPETCSGWFLCNFEGHLAEPPPC